jgi:hypothetical protein
MRPIALLACVVAAMLLPAAAAQAAGRVVLGTPTGPYQRGLGHPHPASVGYGGDGTADLSHLHWSRWGHATATAVGSGRWVWPGQAVATGTVEGTVHVVVSRIRRCHGVRMYTHMVRWIPEYGERYHAEAYEDLCHTDHYPAYHPPADCDDVAFPDGTLASGVKAHGIACATAAALIAASPAEGYAADGGRWRQDGYFCGTDGVVSTLPDDLPSFSCARDRVYVYFTLPA